MDEMDETDEMDSGRPGENHHWLNFLLLVLWVAVSAYFFANVEIQIEGGNGWASSLPTWRVDKHPLLDIFWGGRPMTGYHAWVFSFMFLIFHAGVFIFGKISLRLEARILGCLCWFWIIEDFLWFVMNPAFGMARFHPEHIPWHKQWFLFVPVDYWIFTLVGFLLLGYSYYGVPAWLMHLFKPEKPDRPAQEIEDK